MRLLAAILLPYLLGAELVTTASDPAVVLLRVFVSETSLRHDGGSLADEHGILAVLTRIGGDSPGGLVSAARKYSQRTFPIEECQWCRHARPDRKWVTELDATCAKPPSIPDSDVSPKNWRLVYGKRCKAMLARIRKYLTGWRNPACHSTAKVRDWGGHMDIAIPTAHHWAPVTVWCDGAPAAKNWFWCIPGRAGCYEETRTM